MSTPSPAHGFSGNFTEKEFLDRLKDHERAVKNGLAVGPNVGYVRTHQASALALKLAAPLLEEYYKNEMANTTNDT